MLKKNSGGFVLIEFAIALPLLILIMYSLATVAVEIFKLGRFQLADYVLEEEARYVMERIAQEARVAKEIEIDNASNKIKIVYHAVNDEKIYIENNSAHVEDLWRTQFFKVNPSNGKLYAQRQDDVPLTSPITGNNSFGKTQINSLEYFKANEKLLRFVLEMENVETKHKIKIATAVFMPGCEKFEEK